MIRISEAGRLATFGVIAIASPAIAQAQAPQSEEPSARTAAKDEDIIVTGSRVDLQPKQQTTATFIDVAPLDTPASIAVVPEQLLRNRSITGLDQVLQNLPGIQVGQSDASGRPAGEDAVSRGFPIGFGSKYRDGLRNPSVGNEPLEFYDRVEVLKGLSALQAGFAGPAGLINFITKRPQAKSFVRTDTIVTNWGGGRIMADLNIADIGGGIGVRAVGAYESLKTYLRGFDGNRYSGQLSVSIPVSSTTKIDLDASQSYQLSDYQSPIYYSSNPTAVPYINPRTYYGQPFSGYDSRNTTGSIRVTHAFNDTWKLVVAGQFGLFSRFQTRCNQADVEDVDPVTGEGISDLRCAPNNAHQEGTRNQPSYNAEARLTGRFSVFGIRNDVAVGYQYSYQRGSGFPYSFFYAAIDPPGVNTYTQNVFNPRQYTIPTLYTRQPRTSFNGYQLTINQGPYVQDRISFSDQLQLWIGARYARLSTPLYERAVTSTGNGIAIVDANNNVISGDGSTVFGPAVRTGGYSASPITPTISLTWKPVGNVTTYVTYSQGLEVGGTAPDTAVNAGQIFPPARTETYEGGVKWDIGKAQLTAAIFNIEEPLQVITTGNIFTQSGTERHRGVEFSASGQISRTLSVLAGLMLLDPKQLNVNDPTLEGKRPAGVAKVVANAYAEYVTPLPGFVVSAGAYHVGSQFLFGDDVFKVKGYTKVDLGARYPFALGRAAIAVRVNVENIADTYYISVPASGGGAIQVGAPRTFRFSLGTEF